MEEAPKLFESTEIDMEADLKRREREAEHEISDFRDYLDSKREGGEPENPDIGDREPVDPRPQSGAGAIELPVPDHE